MYEFLNRTGLPEIDGGQFRVLDFLRHSDGAWVNIMTNGMVLGSILVGMVRLDRKPKS